MKRVAIYLRVSTSKQDTDNQRRELEAVAERSGWKVVKVYEDAGISGARAFPDKTDHILSWPGMQRTLIGRSWSETRQWPRINYRRCTPPV